MTVEDPAYDGSIFLIKQFLKNQQMNETLTAFERELVGKNKDLLDPEIPSIQQLVQGFLDLQIRSDGIITKKSESTIEFPVLVDSIKTSASVVACALSDSVLVVSSTDKFVRIYNVGNKLIKEPIKEIKFDQVALSMGLCNNILLITGMAGQIQLYNIKTDEIIYQTKAHIKYVSCCGFSKDGSRFFTGSHDGYFNVYSMDSFQKSHSKKFNGVIESCCTIEDVVYIAVRGDCFIHLIDLNTFECFEKNMNSNGDSWISFTALNLSRSLDGSYLLILTDTPSGRFIIFEALSWNKVADIWGGLSIDRFSHPRGIWVDSSNFMIGDDEGDLSLWNINETKHLGKIHAHNAAIRSFVNSGSCLYVGSFDHSVSLWNLNFKKDF